MTTGMIPTAVHVAMRVDSVHTRTFAREDPPSFPLRIRIPLPLPRCDPVSLIIQPIVVHCRRIARRQPAKACTASCSQIMAVARTSARVSRRSAIKDLRGLDGFIVERMHVPARLPRRGSTLLQGRERRGRRRCCTARHGSAYAGVRTCRRARCRVEERRESHATSAGAGRSGRVGCRQGGRDAGQGRKATLGRSGFVSLDRGQLLQVITCRKQRDPWEVVEGAVLREKREWKKSGIG